MAVKVSVCLPTEGGCMAMVSGTPKEVREAVGPQCAARG